MKVIIKKTLFNIFGYLLEACLEFWRFIFLNLDRIMAIESLKKHMVIAPLICNNITFWLYTGSKQKGCLGCLGGEREERQESSSSRRTQNNTGGTDKEEEEEREREQKERGIGKEQEQESRRELKDC